MKKPIKGKEVIVSSRRIRAACRDLRHHVEHPNERPDIIVAGGTTTLKNMAGLATATIDGIVIGYRVTESSPLEINPFFKREIFIKVPGYRIPTKHTKGDIPDKDFKEILYAACDELLGEQQEMPHVESLAPDSIKLTQHFQVAHLRHKNPNLVDLAGGVNIDREGMIVH